MHMPPKSVAVRWNRNVPSGRQPVTALAAQVAQVLPPGGAVPAPAARRDEAAYDVVAGRDPGYLGPDGLDDARPLVPADNRVARGSVPSTVLVGVTQPRRDEPDQHLARARAVEVKAR